MKKGDLKIHRYTKHSEKKRERLTLEFSEEAIHGFGDCEVTFRATVDLMAPPDDEEPPFVVLDEIASRTYVLQMSIPGGELGSGPLTPSRIGSTACRILTQQLQGLNEAATKMQNKLDRISHS